MQKTDQKVVTVETTMNAPLETVWRCWTEPQHITQWYNASDDWHAPYAENDVRKDGKFKTTMAARDGSTSFDFEGVYTNIEKLNVIEYTLLDGRKVKITFSVQGNQIKVTETFEIENENPLELQRGGWQAILDNFKKYTEGKS